MVILNKYPSLIAGIFISVISFSHQVGELTNLVGTNSDTFYFSLKGGEPNELYEIRTTLTAFKNYTIHVTNIPTSLGFVIVQVHAHIHEVALAYTSSGNYLVKGTNVGLVESKPIAGSATFDLSNLNPLVVSVMINVVGYSKTTPVPGGCNMVFNVEVAPYLELNYTDSMIEVTSQPALSSTYNSNCNRNSLTYEIYHLYQIERDFSMESYFKAVKTMMTVDSIRVHGRRVLPSLIGTNQKKRYSAYPGTGSVYAVVVSETQQGVTKSAAYVPIHTYACSTIRLSGSCNVLNTTLTKTVAATIFCLGMVLCAHGHVAANTEMYIVSSLLSGVFVAYHSHDAVNVGRPLISGLGFGLIWLLMWSCCCSSYISRFSTYLASGIVLTSFAFFAGLGDVQPLENDTNFWLLFGSLTLLSVVIFHVGHHKTCILGCSIVGAYLMITPIDHYIGSNLKYAFVNVMRRAVVENFNTATIDPPFQFRDMIIAVVFLILVVVGFNYQHHKMKKRPEYGQLPAHNFHYFDPSSFNEHTPVLASEEPPFGPGNYPWWFDATSPGSDSVFTSPHTPHPPHPPTHHHLPAPDPHTLGHLASLFGYGQTAHPHTEPFFSDAPPRFIPAALRGNPILRQERMQKPPADPRAPQKMAPDESHGTHGHSTAPKVSNLAPAEGYHSISQGQSHAPTGSPAQRQTKGQAPAQEQATEAVVYPKVPKGDNDSDSDNEAPPPPYDSLHHN